MHRNVMRGFPPPAGAQASLANWRQFPFSRWAFHRIHGQWLYIDIAPPSGVVIAKHSSQPDPVDDALDRLHLSAFDAIARALAR